MGRSASDASQVRVRRRECRDFGAQRAAELGASDRPILRRSAGPYGFGWTMVFRFRPRLRPRNAKTAATAVAQSE